MGREKLKYKLTFNESEPSINPNQIIQQHDTCGIAGDKNKNPVTRTPEVPQSNKISKEGLGKMMM